MKVSIKHRREQLLKLKTNWAFSIAKYQNKSRLIAQDASSKRSVVCQSMGQTNMTLSTFQMSLQETDDFIRAAAEGALTKVGLVSDEVNNINLLMSRLTNASTEGRGRRDTLGTVNTAANVGQTVLSFIK